MMGTHAVSSGEMCIRDSIFAQAKECELNGEKFDEPVLDINGIKEVNWSEPDTLMTAKAMISMKDYMGMRSSKELLLGVVTNFDSSIDEVCAAYLGLDAIREPVLLEVRTLLKDENLDIDQQLKLATALALLGDHTTAQKWYDNNIIPLMEQENDATMIRDYEFTANTLAVSYTHLVGRRNQFVKQC